MNKKNNNPCKKHPKNTAFITINDGDGTVRRYCQVCIGLTLAKFFGVKDLNKNKQ